MCKLKKRAEQDLEDPEAKLEDCFDPNAREKGNSEEEVGARWGGESD